MSTPPHGKGLTANRSGQRRYRVGDYLILAEIKDGKVLILILVVGAIYINECKKHPKGSARMD
jgi:mRNA-degrading endonuclease RelE of RelBE toxin-antitoxin system